MKSRNDIDNFCGIIILRSGEKSKYFYEFYLLFYGALACVVVERGIITNSA